MRKSKFKTVRCVIRARERFLLVVHRGALGIRRSKWGLPGGRIEHGEDFEDTIRREIREELHLVLGAMREVGDYRYKGAFHRVFGTEHDEPIARFDRAEILKIGWHTVDEVAALAASNRLHTGFEVAAIRDFLRILRRP